MSSTYSSDLRIQLMGTGDQAGTWGSTTNNNFQYIFEQAIAGLQTVSVTTTPQALTYLNGATSTLANNQAICATLIFTNGGVNANFTINTPSGSQKTYVIFNNTAYVATMQVTSSSGSTVAIPAYVTTTVYTDGTNFYAGSTGTVGSFGVNGALTVTGNASVSGNETITGTLAVTGATTHTGAVALNGGGTSTTVTPSTDSSTKIATTAFVQSTLPSSGAPLSAAAGGTGEAGTLTGVLYGNGTSAHTVASSTQLVSALGTLPVTSGGTGATSSAGALSNLGAYAASNPSGYIASLTGSINNSQSYHNYTSSGRGLNTGPYQNTSGAPMFLTITIANNNGSGQDATVYAGPTYNATISSLQYELGQARTAGGGQSIPISVIIPNGWWYGAVNNNGGTLAAWFEFY